MQRINLKLISIPKVCVSDHVKANVLLNVAQVTDQVALKIP